MARPRVKPVRIGTALNEYLQRVGLGGLQSASKLINDWPKLVGPGVAGHSSPQDIKGGRLTIIVDSSAWMNQLSLLSNDIIDKVNRGLGGDTVTELRFRIGKIGAAGAKSSSGAQEPPKKRKLSAEEIADVEKAASAIEDPALRAGAKRLLKAAASTKRRA